MKTLSLLVLIICSTASLAHAQPCASLTLTSDTVRPGDPATSRVLLDSTCPGIGGWSYGICHDPAIVDIAAIVDGSTTAVVDGGGPPFFNAIMIYPGQGVTVGAVLSFGTVPLPAGDDYELNVITYNTMNTPAVTSVSFCNTLGVPPVDVIVTSQGNPLVPTTTAGTITLQPDFIRGDCDPDGSFNLVDGTLLLGTLFPSTTMMPTFACADACDCNDDGVVNISDAICIFNALFLVPAPVPPAPYPTCGNDGTADNIGCVQYSPCP
ncbi:MAG: hypothetical protein AAF581_06540 [Planctomycetota bacterium]